MAEEGCAGEVRQTGTISNDLHALEKLQRRIRGDPLRALDVSYQACPFGFMIGHRLKQLGIDCTVVAPLPVYMAHLCRSGDPLHFQRPHRRG